MRFSISTVLFVSPFTNASTKLFPRFKRWGYEAVELLIEDPAHIDPAFVKRGLDRHGLACGSIAAAINPQRDLRGSAASQRRGVKYLCALLDQMVGLNCPVLAGPLYSYVGRAEAVTPANYRHQWNDVVKNLKMVARYAEQRGKLVCIEPINRFETDFLNTFEQGLKLVRDVASPALRLHGDTFHMNIEEKDPAAAIRRAGKQLAHMHVCGSDRGTPGHDHTDWQAVGAALKSIGYRGDIVLETVTLDVPRIAKCAAVWRRMEPTRDEIAKDGLRFLKRALC